MNENPLTESTAYWNKIILGNKSQSEHCNNSAAIQTQIDALFSQSAASKATAKEKKKTTLIQFALLPFWWRNIQERVGFFCRAAVGFACCRFTRFQHEVVCLSCSITIKKKGKKAVEIMLMSLHTYTYAHQVAECAWRVCSFQARACLRVSRRAGRHKVETSSDLAAINSLVICSCLPTLTTLVLGAVWSMGRGARASLKWSWSLRLCSW